ncbi:MAG: chloride channel protein, partial [Mycobacterium leprae]
YLVMALLLHLNLAPTWHLGAFVPSRLADEGAALGVGVAAGLAALLYSHIFRGVGAGFEVLQVPIWLKTTVAGLLIGVLGAAFPPTYFYGRYQINQVVSGSFPVVLLLGMLLAKMLAASITIKGHWQGGLIIPHMFMGAVAGKLVAMLVPGTDPVLAMAAGMAAFNAAATHTPLASALIVLALVGFDGAIPIFLASLVGFFIGQRIELIGNKRHRTEWPLWGAEQESQAS